MRKKNNNKLTGDKKGEKKERTSHNDSRWQLFQHWYSEECSETSFEDWCGLRSYRSDKWERCKYQIYANSWKVWHLMSHWAYYYGLWYTNHEWILSFLIHFEICKNWNTKARLIDIIK